MPPTPIHHRVATGLRRLKLAFVVVAIGGVLALVPFPTCLMRLALGIPCPACGLTRAGLALAHLDVHTAQRMNPLAVALAALVLVTSCAAFVIDDAAWRRLVKIATGAAAAGLIVVWALRFAGYFGGPVAVTGYAAITSTTSERSSSR